MSATFMIAAVGSYVGGCSRKNGAGGDREGGREGGSEESVEDPDVGHILYTGDDTHAVLPLHSLIILYVLDINLEKLCFLYWPLFYSFMLMSAYYALKVDPYYS